MNILVMLSGMTGLLGNLLENWGLADVSKISGDNINRLYYFLIPLFINLALSSLLAKEKDLDPISALLIAMVCFLSGADFLKINASAQITSSHSSVLTSIPCTWFAIELLHYLSKKRCLRLVKTQADISPLLKKKLNLIVPGLITILSFELVSQLSQLPIFLGFGAWVVEIFPKNLQLDEIQELILYKTVSLLTWFIGLHGEHSASSLFRLINETAPGESASIRLKTFHDVFMNIGGSGSTFVIPWLILFSKQIPQFKSIARLSLPFSCFNVNEILLFGLPILLNPIFFIPFLIAPFVGMVIGLTAVHSGLISSELVAIHWMSPPLYSAYVASQGSVTAVFVQVLCILANGLIYLPFLVIASRQYQAPFYLLKLFGEDAYGFINDEINHQQERIFLAQQKFRIERVASAQRVFQQLRGGQFVIYFQPKMDARSLKLVGLEALLRFQDKKGDILPPTFLPTLYQQGLSKDIDQKVVNLVFWQVLCWEASGLSVPPIAINFDKDFLLDNKAVQEFISKAKRHNIRFYIEITEHTYATDPKALAAVVHKLRIAGHRISIDDFGSGYSSLTTLVTLEADEIKLDRALVTISPSEAERGEILLVSSIQLCQDLGFSVVVEGIETQAQLALARRCGAECVQGYYLGKPMSADQIRQLFLQGTNLQPKAPNPMCADV